MANPEPVWLVEHSDDDGSHRDLPGILKLESDREFAGSVKVFGDNATDVAGTSPDDRQKGIVGWPYIHGRAGLGTIHLLNCRVSQWRAARLSHADVSFEYALWGRRPTPLQGDQDRCVKAIAFTLHGVNINLFRGDPVMREFMRSHGKSIGDVIVRAPDTALGSITLTHKDDEAPRVEVIAAKPVTVDQAWDRMLQVGHFLSLIFGHTPRYHDVAVLTTDQSGNTAGWQFNDNALDVYGPREVVSDSALRPRLGALIDPLANAKHLAAVMTRWVRENQDPDWRRANDRMTLNLQGARATLTDRVATAANTFEHIPASHKPRRPANGRWQLENIIRKRAAVITSVGELKDALPEFRTAVHQAYLCRIGDAHSAQSNAKKDVADFTDRRVVRFLAETLEFIYVVSLLVDCDWDVATKHNAWWDHPFGSYVSGYKANVKYLKRTIKTVQPRA